MSASASVQPWQRVGAPDETTLRQMMVEEGLKLYRWSNAPGEFYDAHIHEFHKVIYVVDGSITFILPDQGQSLILNVGDRMDLPAGIAHEAEVGDEGVVCLEGHRY